MKKYFTFIIFNILFIAIGWTQISFNSITFEQGHRGFIATAIADMNNDYLDDIIRINYYGQVSICYQKTDGSFNTVDVDSVKYESISYGSWSICVGDINADNYNDFFIGNHDNQYVFTSNNSINYTKNLLDSTFFAQGANFIDIDLDGDLDLFVCNDDSTNYVYANNGLGEMTIDTSLITTLPSSGNYSSIWSDYDNDQDLDLYISKCKHGVTDSTDLRRINLLYRNDGNGNYTEVATSAGIADGSQSWSSDFGDIDNDGDFDLIIANHESYHRLYRNNNDGTFTKITNTSGIDEYTNAGVFQSLFNDLDNDGWIDLILANQDNDKIIYRNDGDGTFTLENNPLDENKLYSISLGDLNNDGFIDIYSIRDSPPPNTIDDQIHFNNGNSNNFIGFIVEESSLKNSIGTKLKLYGDWGVQMREIRSGESYGIHNSYEKIFGLGTSTSFDSLVITTLDNNKCVFSSVSELNSKYTVDLQNCTLSKIVPVKGISTTHNKDIFIYTKSRHIFIKSKEQILKENSIQLFGIQGNIIPFTVKKEGNTMKITPKYQNKILMIRIDNELFKVVFN